jgi:RNA polymerase primary sigma factor
VAGSPQPQEDHVSARQLTRDEEIRLASAIEQGDRAAKDTMIESNLGLVRATARTFGSTALSLDDLVQEGTVGLVQAVARFDHRRGVRFATYAAWWIRRAILDAIDNSSVIRTPPKARRQLAAIRRAEDELARTHAGPASDARISERSGLSASSVQFLRTAANVTASLDEPAREDRAPLLELVADESAVDPGRTLIEHENRDEVTGMVRLLPPRHREVVIRRFGLNGAPEESHAEIGRRLGVSEERSRQLEREALHRLRSVAGRLTEAA